MSEVSGTRRRPSADEGDGNRVNDERHEGSDNQMNHEIPAVVFHSDRDRKVSTTVGLQNTLEL